MLVKNFETNRKKSQSQTCIALGMPLPRLCGLQADTPFLEVWVPLLPHMSYRYLCKHISGIVTCTCAAPYANIRAKTSCTSWGGNPCLLHPDLPPDREPAPSGQGRGEIQAPNQDCLFWCLSPPITNFHPSFSLILNLTVSQKAFGITPLPLNLGNSCVEEIYLIFLAGPLG